MSQKSPAEIAHSDHRDIPDAVNPQGLFDSCQQILHIIANSTNAELAEIGQVLTDLRGINTARAGQSFGRDDLLSLLKKGFQNLDI